MITEHLSRMEKPLTAMYNNYFSATLPAMPKAFSPSKSEVTEREATAVHLITSAVCEFYGIPEPLFASSSRKDDVVMARHIVRYLLHEQEGYGPRKLARIAGIDHARAVRSLQLVKGYIDTGGKVEAEIGQIRTLLIA